MKTQTYSLFSIARSLFSNRPPDVMADFQFTDTPFDAEASIPTEFTCDGEDVSPPLEWTAPPDGTESLVLLVEDPDAPVPKAFTHWILFNLPADAQQLPRHYRTEDPHPSANGLEPHAGRNDFGDVGYGGPCPPDGDDPHRYFFRLHALDTTLDLDPGAEPDAVAAAIDGHVLATAEHVGTYQRNG